jgi:hypothetical protein
MPIKFTYKHVKEHIESLGLKLLSNEYLGIDAKLDILLKCGCSRSTTFYRIKNGHTSCNSCHKKLSNKEVEEGLKKLGLELLSKYNNNREKIKFRCSCGKVHRSTYDSIRRGTRCKECGKNKRRKNFSGPNNPKWNPDREQVKLNKLMSNRYRKLVRRLYEKTGEIKDKSSHELLGYSQEELTKHLESFTCFDSIKDKDWHIDHIFPIKAFLEYGITDADIVNALDNLRPVLASENLGKNDAYDKDEFKKYLVDRRLL